LRARLPAAAKPGLRVQSQPQPQTLPASNRLEAALGPGRSRLELRLNLIQSFMGLWPTGKYEGFMLDIPLTLNLEL
jgi:hypothetical protein